MTTFRTYGAAVLLAMVIWTGFNEFTHAAFCGQCRRVPEILRPRYTSCCCAFLVRGAPRTSSSETNHVSKPACPLGERCALFEPWRRVETLTDVEPPILSIMRDR